MFSAPRNILVIEDHDDSAMILAQMLRKHGHVASIARTCAETRHSFATDTDINAVLIDIGLPDGNGCDLLQELNAMRPVPAIAVTGYGMAHDIERSAKAGFIAHIVKPVIMSALTELLASLKAPLPPRTPQTGGGGESMAG